MLHLPCSASKWIKGIKVLKPQSKVVLKAKKIIIRKDTASDDVFDSSHKCKLKMRLEAMDEFYHLKGDKI